jgi:hypothetical protein
VALWKPPGSVPRRCDHRRKTKRTALAREARRLADETERMYIELEQAGARYKIHGSCELLFVFTETLSRPWKLRYQNGLTHSVTQYYLSI